MLKHKKIITVVITVLVTSIFLFCLDSALPSIYQYVSLQNKEKTYLFDKNFENWFDFCDSLRHTEEYDLILEYFPDYLESEELQILFLVSTNYNITDSFDLLNGFRYFYANALLNTEKYDDFKEYVRKLYGLYQNSLCESSFYTIVSDCILTSEYNNEELQTLLEVLIEVYEHCETTELKYQNYCIQSYIYNTLDDDATYDAVQKEIVLMRSQLNEKQGQSGGNQGTAD